MDVGIILIHRLLLSLLSPPRLSSPFLVVALVVVVVGVCLPLFDVGVVVVDCWCVFVRVVVG